MWGRHRLCLYQIALPSHEVELRIFGVYGTRLPPLKAVCSLSCANLLSLPGSLWAVRFCLPFAAPFTP